MAIVITDTLTYHLATPIGQVSLVGLLNGLTTEGVDVPKYPTETKLCTDGPDGAGAIKLRAEDSTSSDSLKIVVRLTPLLPLLFATSLVKNSAHLMHDPINPCYLHVYRVYTPSPEE
jgi:hypothetical protein